MARMGKYDRLCILHFWTTDNRYKFNINLAYSKYRLEPFATYFFGPFFEVKSRKARHAFQKRQIPENKKTDI